MLSKAIISMYAKDVLKKVRYNLSDTASDRWTDARLLSLLNDGIKNIAITTTLFVETIFYVVTDLVVDIDLSDSALKILRAEYNDKTLPFYTFDEMDNNKDNITSGSKVWQQDTGDEVLALVYDKQKNSLLKQYPIVSNAQNDNIVYSGDYGIITYISYSDIAPVVTDLYGDLGDIPDDALIKFYYVRKHVLIDDINDTLYIDDLVEQPLIHYITGMALRDNQDTQNRNMAKEELQMYDTLIEQYSIEKSQLYVRTSHEVRYRPND